MKKSCHGFPKFLSILTLSMVTIFFISTAFIFHNVTPRYALVIHGGAGYRSPGNAMEDMKYISSINNALDAGQAILAQGGSSMDAISQVIMFLEDDSLFNAGRGSVFTYEGRNEMDASIMDGSNKKAGSVAGVRTIKNPIQAARLVLEKTSHVLLAGRGAEEFAAEQMIPLRDSIYFFTKASWDEHIRSMKPRKSDQKHGNIIEPTLSHYGTVGAVALDQHGNIAAATSTGGLNNKRWNRIGDSPIIGAGTYADNRTCGISCTGTGEYFIRLSVAHDMHARMLYKKQDIRKAGKDIIQKELTAMGGAGGLIGIDRKGQIVMEFNTTAMVRGYCTPESRKVLIYKE